MQTKSTAHLFNYTDLLIEISTWNYKKNDWIKKKFCDEHKVQ